MQLKPPPAGAGYLLFYFASSPSSTTNLVPGRFTPSSPLHPPPRSHASSSSPSPSAVSAIVAKPPPTGRPLRAAICALVNGLGGSVGETTTAAATGVLGGSRSATVPFCSGSCCGCASSVVKCAFSRRANSALGRPRSWVCCTSNRSLAASAQMRSRFSRRRRSSSGSAGGAGWAVP